MLSEISQVRFISEVLRIVVEAVVSPDCAEDAAQCHPMHIIFSYRSSWAIVDEGWLSAIRCLEHLISHDLLILESGRLHCERSRAPYNQAANRIGAALQMDTWCGRPICKRCESRWGQICKQYCKSWTTGVSRHEACWKKPWQEIHQNLKVQRL